MASAKRHRPLKTWVRMFLSVCIIALISTGIICIIDANDIEIKDDIIKASYNVETKPIDYKVYYYENEFYPNEYYEKGSQYVSDLVENIHFNFNYNFDVSKISRVEYTYSLSGILVGSYETTSDNSNAAGLYNPEYDFGKETFVKDNVTGINIEKEFDFDFQEYNDIVTNYRETLGIPITSYMDLVFNVDLTATVEGDEINKTTQQTVRIPLNQKAFSVSENTPKKVSENIIQKTPKEEIDKDQIYIGMILIISGVLMFVILFKKLFNIKPRNHYNIELSRILKGYGDVIIELVNGVSEEDLDIVLVKGFNELLDLEEELRIPINFIETYPNYEGEFTILHDKVLYKYILTNEEEI